MIRPIRNNILIKPFKGKDVSEGGIFIPDNLVEYSNKGEIVAVGNGSKNRPMRLSVGDIVFRVKSWGIPIEQNGETFFLMDENAVLATD